MRRRLATNDIGGFVQVVWGGGVASNDTRVCGKLEFILNTLRLEERDKIDQFLSRRHDRGALADVKVDRVAVDFAGVAVAILIVLWSFIT